MFSFSYDGREVIHDVTFDIPQGTTMALVGPSGSGKTTLSSLMARFYDVDSGSVCVGGHDVREFTVDSLLRNFSMVFQDVYLFDDTIEANIAFGCEGATHEMVIQAAKRAQCHDFIMKLPKGYDTPVKMGGLSLSGGERQRISIARALAKDTSILLCDEPTGALDYETGKQILELLENLCREKHKTVVIVTHTQEIGKMADRVIRMRNGKIIETKANTEPVSAKDIEW